MWQKRRHRLLKRLFLGRRFVPLAFALFCLLTVFALFLAFSSKGDHFNAIDERGSNPLPGLGQRQNDADDDTDGDDNGGSGDGLAPSPGSSKSLFCQCDGWRAHFTPAETEARVFQSVRREHIELMGKLNEAQAKMDAMERKMGEKEAELAKLVLRVEELKLLHREYSDSRAVRVQLPHSPPRGRHSQTETEEEEGDSGGGGGTKLDFSRCSIAVPSMPLVVHRPLSVDDDNGTFPSSPSALARQFHRQFVHGQRIASIVPNATIACLSITIIDNGTRRPRRRQKADKNDDDNEQEEDGPTAAEGWHNVVVGTLSHRLATAASGQNHLVLDLHGLLSAADQKQLLGPSTVLVTPRSDLVTMRIRDPQLVWPLHLDVPVPSADRWRELPPLLPVVRKYFVRLVANPALLSRRQSNDLAELKKSLDSSRDSHLVDLECPLPMHPHNSSMVSPSSPSASTDHFCYAVDDRLRMGRQSVFTVLLFPELPSFQQLFYESLLTGSVPVLCSHRPAALPFAHLVDWRLATVQIAADRFPELHFLLRAIPLADLVEMKRKGRFFLEHYLADTKVIVDAVLSAMRVLLQLPGGEQPEPEAVPLYRTSDNSSSSSASSSFAAAFPSFISSLTKPPYDDEYLGPIELPLESPAYEHNFTALSLYSAKIWNHFPMALGTSPRFLPFAHFLPSDAEFGEDTAFGMRPILPGSGQEFALALGGNRVREQFTIMILTYNREQVLLSTLERLNNLPYLNRVIVIWNDVHREPATPAWPRLHVPVLFINGTRNSLNNRFIPYKEIETEAILSMDDDMDIKQFEIVFAFRVWRENRDRIVGFPARYHARFGDDNFYNSNHTCQYSMILTGAAFIHKFYLHAYSYHMPEIIRLKVDEWMNCEDLAMNFLVSHLTRKAPIKTTSKWTLRCPSCPEMLSNDGSHFVERHQCIRFFARVYGYNPLVFSQFRADSVLFKTRVPQNHQKCFRYV